MNDLLSGLLATFLMGAGIALAQTSSIIKKDIASTPVIPQITRAESASSGDQSPDNLTDQAQKRMQQSDLPGAQRLLELALAASPNHPGANNVFGNLLLLEHHYREAMDRFETVLATNLRDPTARAGELNAATSLALESRRSGDQTAAYRCLQHAREHLPDDPTLLLDLGIQAQQMKLLPSAAEVLNAALSLRPGDPTIVYALARVDTDQQHLPSAEGRFRTYLATRPNDASAHFGLGHVLEMQQRIDEAKAEFQRSIDLQPVQTESYFQLGQIALDAGQPETAAPLFEKTLARDPHHGGALSGLGILAYRRKDFASARSLLTAAVQSSPDYQPAHYYLGLTFGRLGNKADSERELKTATDLAHRQDPHAASAEQPTPASPP